MRAAAPRTVRSAIGLLLLTAIATIPVRPCHAAESGSISPLDYGARCDGSTDDAIGINKALDQIRSQHAAGDATPLVGHLVLPARQCTIRTTINATGLASSSVVIQGTGGVLLCSTAGAPCIDATNSGRLGLRDLTVYGTKDRMPSIGLQVGRPRPNGSAAGMYIDHPSLTGYFSFTAFYNLSAETQLVIKMNASNQADGGYGAVYDGTDHWRAKSAFVPMAMPIDTQGSFNDNTCENCRITSSGTGGVPLWISGTAELTFENSYISNFNTGPGAILYANNINPDFDAHFEASNLTSLIVLAGSPHVILHGLKLREHDAFARQSIFALAPEVRVAELQNVDIDMGRSHYRGEKWFDDPQRYTMSGRVSAISADGWAEPGGGFSGSECFGTKCTVR